jgi:hypothetical protein
MGKGGRIEGGGRGASVEQAFKMGVTRAKGLRRRRKVECSEQYLTYNPVQSALHIVEDGGSDDNTS